MRTAVGRRQTRDAFVDYGVGVGAKGQVKGSKVTVTESFQLPAGCTAIP